MKNLVRLHLFNIDELVLNFKTKVTSKPPNNAVMWTSFSVFV